MNVVGTKRLGRLEHRAQHSVCPGQWTHRGNQLAAHARDDEAAKPTLTIRHAQRGESGAGKLPRAVNELLENLLDRALRGNRQHRIADSFESGAERAFGVGYVLQGMQVCPIQGRASLGFVSQMPRSWIVMQALIVVFVVAGMVIALTRLI